MAVLWLVICAVIGIGLFAFALGMAKRFIGGSVHEKGAKDQICSSENSVDAAIYAYDSEISGLDDIKAKHLGIYRDTGVITGIEDELPVCRESFLPTKDNNRELSLVIRSAAEVKRITDKTVIYFFTKIRELNIKSSSVRAIYNSINCGIKNNRPMALQLTRSTAGADGINSDTE